MKKYFIHPSVKFIIIIALNTTQQQENKWDRGIKINNSMKDKYKISRKYQKQWVTKVKLYVHYLHYDQSRMNCV